MSQTRPQLSVLRLSNLPMSHLLHLRTNRLAHPGQVKDGVYPTLSATWAAVVLKKVSTSAKFPKKSASVYGFRQLQSLVQLS